MYHTNMGWNRHREIQSDVNDQVLAGVSKGVLASPGGDLQIRLPHSIDNRAMICVEIVYRLGSRPPLSRTITETYAES